MLAPALAAEAPRLQSQASVGAGFQVMASREKLPVPKLRARNGLKTTASTAAARLVPERGPFYGFRDTREDWARTAAIDRNRPDVRDWVNYNKAKLDEWASRRGSAGPGRRLDS